MPLLEFRLLGPVEVTGSTESLSLGGPRGQSILAALLLDLDRVVSIDHLVSAAWGEEPPATARIQAQNRVAVLRRVLRPYDDAAVITTSGSGYRLHVADGRLDLHRFERLVAYSETMLAAGDRLAAVAALREALLLWRGPALDALRTAPLATAAQRLEEQRMLALEKRIEIELALGRHTRLLPELTTLTRAHPYRERLWEYLMLALYRAGRQAEALHAFREVRAVLIEQLGVEPAPALRRLHEALLRGDAPAAGADMPVAAGGRVRRRWHQIVHRPPRLPTPRQLPADVPGFTGRATELMALDAALAERYGGMAGPVVALFGTAGVGKTALAVHWAHRVVDGFPDGQLYVDLHGFDPASPPASVAEVLRGLLDAFGMPAELIPAGLDAQAALYRSLLAGRRVLIVLDGARDAEQVRPLLPGSSGCLAVVTSRNRLTSLVAAEGARPITVDPFDDDESWRVLARRLGRERLVAEPGAVGQIIVRCVGLPLALTAVAARATMQPGISLRSLAAGLRDARTRIDAIEGGDPGINLRSAFFESYRHLSPRAARLFRLAGLHTGPPLTSPVAATLADLPVDEAELLLTELTRAHLFTELSPGQYTLHELLRAYAAELGYVDDRPAGGG